MEGPPNKKRKGQANLFIEDDDMSEGLFIPREVGLAECVCNHRHESKAHCEKAKKITLHKEIVSISVLEDFAITVRAGQDARQFIAHRELLTTYSSTFRSHYDSKPEERIQCTVVQLPDIEPQNFANFLVWLYTGEIPKRTAARGKDFRVQTRWKELWALGEYLQAPSFQNYCMVELFAKGGERGSQWPAFDQVAHMYRYTKSGSMLRKLAVNALAFRRGNEKGTWGESQDEWRDLLEKTPELSVDINCLAARTWTKSSPWYIHFRKDYTVAERPLINSLAAQNLLQTQKADPKEAPTESAPLRQEATQKSTAQNSAFRVNSNPGIFVNRDTNNDENGPRARSSSDTSSTYGHQQAKPKSLSELKPVRNVNDEAAIRKMFGL